MINSSDIIAVLSQFGIDGEGLRVEKLGNGHINETLLIDTQPRKLVLQKINSTVFPNPKAVIKNASLLCQFLSDKLEHNTYTLKTLECIPTKTGKFEAEVNGQVWRALSYIPNCHSPEQVVTEEQAYDTAYAFGTFASAFSEFDESLLDIIIPKFHDLTFRFEQLAEAITLDLAGRVEDSKNEIRFAQQQQQVAKLAQTLEQRCPRRVTHNDTKINNLLVNDFTHKPEAVVDLDTCMSGYVMHDFGDMVRTCCSNLAEDDSQVSAMTLKKDIFKALAKGYLAAWNGKLTSDEIESLWLGAKMMPLMIGIRFLTDHLNGDKYFAVNRENHNLDRAINQFALYRSVCQHEDELSPLFLIEESVTV